MAFLRESVPDYSIFDTMFKWNEKRGLDGFGILKIFGRHQHLGCSQYIEPLQPYTHGCYESVKSWMSSPQLQIGDIVLSIARAAPETESLSSPDNMQPIANGDENGTCYLIHNGAVSNKIDEHLRTSDNSSKFKYSTNIDSESIIAAYLRYQRNMKNTMEYLSGGYSFIMVDSFTKQIHLVNDFKPLAISYIKGVGFFAASDNNCLRELVQQVTDCPRDGMNIWEYYYAHNQGGYTIRTIDIESGFERTQKFRPRFITSNWDSSTKAINKDLCAVACSGGLDSTLTLSVLKAAGYDNIVACHFKYGHRGQQCEETAIKKVCKLLDIPIKIFDIESIMREIDTFSMLTDDTKEIRTGTAIALKTTEAWVCSRNSIFMVIMTAFVEAQVMLHNYSSVYLLGGFLNLTESGTYPDNSEYFLSSFLEHAKYGTLIGDRIKPLYCLSNIMKSEQWLLVKHLGLEDIIQHTISCDRPKMFGGIPHNCSYNGKPACGSGLLSWWGAKMAGCVDNRNFYNIEDDENYTAYEPKHMSEGSRTLNIIDVINRIQLPQDKKDILLNNIKG